MNMKTVTIPTMTLAGLLHRKPQAARLTLVPESHAGQHGYSIYEGGHRVAWGASRAAAMAAYGVVRSA